MRIIDKVNVSDNDDLPDKPDEPEDELPDYEPDDAEAELPFPDVGPGGTKPPRGARVREEEIDVWVNARWEKFRKSDAQYLNIGDYHIAVWESDEHPGEWTYHIQCNNPISPCNVHGNRIRSREQAKREVLKQLADRTKYQ